MTGTPPIHPEALTVLLVEDDPVTADVVLHAVGRDPGLRVRHVTDGGTALSVIQREQFAAAILDIRLPVLDGLYLLLTIREDPRYQDLPVIMLTSLGSEADVIRGFELGADDYLVKPFSPTELTLRLQRLLGRRPSARSRRVSRPAAPPPPAPLADTSAPPAPPPVEREARPPAPRRSDPEIPPFEFDD
jgi:DNA-binding response OmpR family regulator